jgi:hypothetical protein
MGPRLWGTTAGKPILLEGFQRLIKRGPGEAESRRGASQRVPLVLHAAQHLVLDLDQISGIEKAVVGKQGIGDSAGPWV